MSSYTKLINDLTRVAKLIPIKGLTKDLINSWKYFSSDASQNYLVFQQFLVTLHLKMMTFVHGN